MAVYSQRNLALARFGGNTADTLLAAHTRRHFVSQISTANTRSFVSEVFEFEVPHPNDASDDSEEEWLCSFHN